MAQRKFDTVLKRIAQKHLRVSTLEPRRSDRLDFYKLSVWNLKDALEAAYQTGAESDVATEKAGE